MMLCILLLSAYASVEVRFYGNLGVVLKAGTSVGVAKAPCKLPCVIWIHMSAFKAGIRLMGKMHPSGNGFTPLSPPTTQQQSWKAA
ncbi:hypothetical protein [Neisseria sicca]|uniref:hypothetical protein n=1 Tax=Neisseria sicca TaxID=490 RepID=UPI0028EAD552|nr:hypothetical protein [Neisseria sicca]